MIDVAELDAGQVLRGRGQPSRLNLLVALTAPQPVVDLLGPVPRIGDARRIPSHIDGAATINLGS